MANLLKQVNAANIAAWLFLFFFDRTHFLSRTVAQVLELPAHLYLATLPALYFMVLELCFTSKRKHFPQSDILLLPHYCKATLHWYPAKHYLPPFQFAVSMCQTYHYFDSCQGSIRCAFLHLYKHMHSNLFKWIVFGKLKEHDNRREERTVWYIDYGNYYYQCHYNAYVYLQRLLARFSFFSDHIFNS